MTSHPQTAVAALLTLILCASATAEPPRRALRVEVEPNALQRLKDGLLPPMTIDVLGAVPGSSVHFEVLRDCNADGLPDRQGTEECPSPVDAWTSPPADENHRVLTELDFEARDWPLPDNVGLWLRVAPSTDGKGTLAPFGLVRNACDLWKSLVDTFFGGDCDPGLLQALRKHKGPAGLETVTFEVRRLSLGQDEAEAVPVPGTLGATGIAWAKGDTLLVTRAPTVSGLPPILPRDQETADVPPGLYRVRLDAQTQEPPEPELLWKPEDGGLMPAAPLLLPGGRIAFVRQSLTGDPLIDEAADVNLSFWSDGTLEAGSIPLPYRVHQLLDASADGHQILALTLGVRSNRPLLMTVDLRGDEPAVDVVGYHHGLYSAALRSPDGKTSAIALDDASGRWGWELILVDREGEWVRDIAHRKKLHDLMPAWRPDGGELAYLAEVSRIEGRLR